MLYFFHRPTQRSFVRPFLAWIAVLCQGGVLGSAWGGLLTGNLQDIPQGSDVNLTEVGTIDWVHWGLYTETSLNRKAGVVAQISDFHLVDASNGFAYVYQYGDNFNTYSWSDGNPESMISETPTGVWVYGTPLIGSGFRISVPAGTEVRTLKVYVGAYAATGRFQASLSDGSASAYSNVGPRNNRNGPSGVYTLNFAADSPGQTLTIIYTLATPMAAEGNVTLQAAALTVEGGNNPPVVTLTNPEPDMNIAASSDVIVQASATDTDGSVASVEFFVDDSSLGMDSSGPSFAANWNNVSPGRYHLVAVATDNEGAQTTSPAVEVFVFGTGGSLSGMTNLPPVSVNLTVEGGTDWIHWGYATNATVNRKAEIAPQISSLAILGTNEVNTYTDNLTAYAWSDGTPTLAANGIDRGVFITGVTNGFQITAPADSTPRRLKVYVGLYGSTSRLQAYLSDYSAMAYSDQSLSNVYGNSYAVYIFDYSSATPGQSLIVRYRSDQLFDQDYGNVTIQAATLTGGVAKNPVTLFNPFWRDNQLHFSFLSELDQSYTVQFISGLGVPPWMDVRTLTGTGEIMTVTNETDIALEGFYRVLTE